MRIDYGQVEECYNEVYQTILNIKTNLQELKDKTDSFSSGDSWVGPAADNFNSSISGITTQFDEIFKSIDDSVIYLDKVKEKYKNFEQIIISNFNIIK